MGHKSHKAPHAGAGVRWGRGAHLSAPLFSAAASASLSRRQSAAASPVIIRLTPARMNRGPRPAFHFEYRKLRLMRCALQNSATVNAISPGGPADSDPLLSGPVLLWRCGACSNDKLRLHLRRMNGCGQLLMYRYFRNSVLIDLLPELFPPGFRERERTQA